jgi:hypothetical protein
MNRPPLRIAAPASCPHPLPATTASTSSPKRSTTSPASAPPTGSATPASTSTPSPASSPKPNNSCPRPSPTPATRNSPGPRSANSSAPPPQPQHAATRTSHDQLDKDHRHNADVSVPVCPSFRARDYARGHQRVAGWPRHLRRFEEAARAVRQAGRAGIAGSRDHCDPVTGPGGQPVRPAQLHKRGPGPEGRLGRAKALADHATKVVLVPGSEAARAPRQSQAKRHRAGTGAESNPSAFADQFLRRLISVIHRPSLFIRATRAAPARQLPDN